MSGNSFNKFFRVLIIEKRSRIIYFLNNALFYLSLIGLGIFIYDLGFVLSIPAKNRLSSFYQVYSLIIFLILTLRLFLINRIGIRKGWFVVEYLLILILLAGMVLTIYSDQLITTPNYAAFFFKQNFFTFGVIWYVFLIELSKRTLTIYHNRFNPALLFAGSFIILIFIGTGLLMLPRATLAGIGFMDALFTATSAVCVTGLIVVDTATYFTTFGQLIIIILIQIGGLGIITFTSFLGMFFQRGSSFQNQLFIQNMINEENIGQTMRAIVNIIITTLLIELIGAFFVYFSINPAVFGSEQERIGFALFHAISAFCNAGFSTLTAGLYDINFRYAYFFQSVIMLLIILGGIGFPIILNLYRLGEQTIQKRLRQLTSHEKYVHSSRKINIHTKMVLATTGILLAGGAILYFLTEYNSTLREHQGIGKVVAALFGSVTPRTAGFNTVDMSQLTVPTILIYLLLMWIGASPASTGGGIKTTTFAVAILNTLSIAKGKDRLEAFHREITDKSVRQAFAVMLLSFLVIGLAIFLILFFDPEQKLIQVAFEVFSAFSTVGLSLNLTSELNTTSRLIIIITMFLGRVGTFTLIAAMVTKAPAHHYRYPAESIIIT